MIVLVAIGFVLVFAGVAGSILPVLPGPPLSYAALILLSIAYHWAPFSAAFLIVTGVLTAAVTLLDYFLPVLVSKKYGASRYGIWGSIIGMVAGAVFFPPFGLIIGTLAGAVLGELIFNRERRKSLRAGLGVFVGTLLATFLKLALCLSFAFYYTRAVLHH
jgi:uncharacterized protein YqgC (DUF456 family)